MIAAAVCLGGAAPAQAEAGSPVVVGAFTVQLTAGPTELDRGYEIRGKLTYNYGSGCTTGTGCSMSTSSSNGDEEVRLAPGAGGLRWRTVHPLPCIDTETREVAVKHGIPRPWPRRWCPRPPWSATG